MTVLALETSCDETAVAILGDDGRVALRRLDAAVRHPCLLASEVASQVAAHEKYGGVCPGVAARNHPLYAPPLLDPAAAAAKTPVFENDAFAAPPGPPLSWSFVCSGSIVP